MKTKTIKQTGILVGGYALLNLWGGGQGEIQMDRVFIPNGKITHNAIYDAVNDGQFGCESIERADVHIYIQYDNGTFEHDRIIYITDSIKFLNCKRGI